MNAQSGFVRFSPSLALALCIAVLAPAPETQAQQTPAPPATPAAPPGELFPIPKVIERPLGLEEGPRLRVTGFVLRGATSRPGIDPGEVQEILAAAQAAQPAEGYAINQLQEVANQVTRYYRDAGLILAQAFIPEQEVANGEVVVQVLEGKLGAIRVEGNKSYSAAILTRPFDDLIGAPVVKDEVEESLLRITDYAGLSAFGVFSAGADVGTTDLVLRVQDEDRVNFDASVDNHGSRFSGEYRGHLGLTFNNLFGLADSMRLYALQAFDPDDSEARGTYGGIELDLPMSARSVFRLSAATNAYDVGQTFGGLGLAGETLIGSVAFDFSLTRSRFGSSTFTLDFSRKEATFERDGVATNEDVLAVGALGYRMNYIDTRLRGVNQLAIRMSRGFDGVLGALEGPGEPLDPDDPPPSRSGATGQFTKTTFDLQRLQRLSSNTSVLLRGFIQHTGDLLTSLEQYSLGGPYSVRAYPTSEFLVDRGLYASVELIASAPGFASRPAFGDRTWGQVLQFSLFADWANGEVLGTVLPGIDPKPEISGYGAGVQFNVPGRAFFRADAARPIGDPDPSNDRDPQYFVRFGLTF